MMGFIDVDLDSSIAAVAAFVTAAGTLYISWKNGRKINNVQLTVNHRLDQALTRIDQLTHALEHSDTDVPEAEYPDHNTSHT